MSDKDPKAAPRLDEFLNPASMLTPGLAGSVTMLITNALSAHFQLAPSWTGLLISFLCGTLVFVSSVGAAKKLVYYVLNSLIIFSVAAGTSGFAATATRTAQWTIGVTTAQAASGAASDTSFALAQAATTEGGADAVGLEAHEAHEAPGGLSAGEADLQMLLDAARQELEAAKSEAEAARKEAEAARLENEANAAQYEALKAIREPEAGFFKHWF